MKLDVAIYYLEMTYPEQLRPKEVAWPGIRFGQVHPPDPEQNRYFYREVGREWLWIDRLAWSDAEWTQYVHAPNRETWVLWVNALRAGYVEMERHVTGGVQLVYFGLVPQFIGQGLGGVLLTAAVRRAWSWGGRYVWLHTCSLDHPAALAHYQARGFRIYHQEVVTRSIPARHRELVQRRLRQPSNGPRATVRSG